MLNLLAPYRSARALHASVRVRPAVLLVLASGLYLALGMFISYLNRSYPPPPEVLEIWVDAWGEFTMLPFLKIPPESYRLFTAFIALPLVFAMWMLMAGSAKLLSLLMGGRATYEQYLVVTAFGFFPFWLLAAVIDTIFSGIIDVYVLRALTGQLGSTAAFFWTSFPVLFYTVLYTLGGVWIGIAAAGLEDYQWWQSTLVALLTFAWPMLLMSALLR